MRLAVFLVALLAMTLAAGYLLTRADEGDAFERLDRALVGWTADHRTETLTAISGPAAELGNTWVVVGIAAVVAALAGLAFHSWRPIVLLAVALCGEVAIFLTTTALIDRPRPPVQHLDDTLPPTSSFPSGHTAAAICLYGSVAVLVLCWTRRRWRSVVVGIALAIIVSVAAARLYRGAHYPTDVLGSVLFAVPWLLVTVRALPPPPITRPAGVGEWRA